MASRRIWFVPVLAALAGLVPAQEEKPGLKKVEKAEPPRAGQEAAPPREAPAADPIRRLEERLQRFLERLEGRLVPPGTAAPQSQVQGSEVRIQVGPDGVVVEVRERDESGEEQVRTYKARDLEEFRQAHPEVARKYGIGMSGSPLRLRFGRLPDPWSGEEEGEWFGDLRRLLERLPEGRGALPVPFGRSRRVLPAPGPPGPAAAAPEGERLGIYANEISADLGRYLALPEGVGVMVEEVVAGSLAEKAGLAVRDIILEVNGRPTRGIAAIREGLKATPEDGQVKIVVHRGGQKVELGARREAPPPAPKGEVKELKKA